MPRGVRNFELASEQPVTRIWLHSKIAHSSHYGPQRKEKNRYTSTQDICQDILQRSSSARWDGIILCSCDFSASISFSRACIELVVGRLETERDVQVQSRLYTTAGKEYAQCRRLQTCISCHSKTRINPPGQTFALAVRVRSGAGRNDCGAFHVRLVVPLRITKGRRRRCNVL